MQGGKIYALFTFVLFSDKHKLLNEIYLMFGSVTMFIKKTIMKNCPKV